MKNKIRKLYIVIPIIYVLLMVAFFLFHFLGKDSFHTDSIGYLKISGKKSRSIMFSPQKIIDLTANFGEYHLILSGKSPVVLEYKNGQKEACKIESYILFDKNIEIKYTNKLALSINVSGEFGSLAVVSIKELPYRDSIKKIFIHFRISGKDIIAPDEIPVISCKSSFEQFFLSLQHDSVIDMDKKVLVIEYTDKKTTPLLYLEKGEDEYQDPFIYWFLERTSPVSQNQYERKVNEYISASYKNWISDRYDEDENKWLNQENQAVFDEDIAKSILSESLRIYEDNKNVYNKAIALVRSAISRQKREKPQEKLPFLTGTFLGNLKMFVEKRQELDPVLLKDVENLILHEDPSVFKIPHLILLLLDRGNKLQLDELVSRIVNNVNPDSVDISICLGMIDAYYDIVRLLENEEEYFQKYKSLLLTHVIPRITQTDNGLFLTQADTKKVNTFESIYTGYICIKASTISGYPGYYELGQKLIVSALSLSDEKGFLPEEFIINSFHDQEYKGTLLPEKVYDFIVFNGYIPGEFPISPETRPGTWLWTAARDVFVERTSAELRLTMTFPEGFTHYLFVQGIDFFPSVSLHGEEREENPEYSDSAYGWYYNNSIQTLYIKLNHRNSKEEIIISD